MNTWDVCKNCGAERGLHHYQTDQCPVGGREAPIGRKQEWKSTTFEIDESDKDSTIASQSAEIQRLRNLLECVAFPENTRECSHCDGSGTEPESDHDACEICGGYGFNPGGDIRQAIIDVRAELEKSKA